MAKRKNQLIQDTKISPVYKLVLAVFGSLILAGLLTILQVQSTEGCAATEASVDLPNVIMPALDLAGTDPLTVISTPSGNEGSTTIYLLTDERGVIQDVQSSPSFSSQGAGGFLIYASTYNGIVSNLAIGDTITQASSTECLDISEALPMVGFYAAEFSNVDPITFPATIPPSGTNTTMYLLTDINGNIVETNTSNSFLSKAAGGMFFIYSLSLSDAYSPDLGSKIDTLTIPGTSYFSDPYPIAVNGSLFPVEWLGFSASVTEEGSMLEWLTASEINSDYFSVERSADGREFDQIGQVKAAGNSEDLKEYEFADTQFRKLGIDKAFYRLRQVDLDGAFEYSDVVELNLQGNIELNLTAFPNPFSEKLQIRFTPVESTQLSVFDAQGKLMMSKVFSPGREKTYGISTATWPVGMYFIRTESESASDSFSVIKR